MTDKNVCALWSLVRAVWEVQHMIDVRSVLYVEH